MICLGSTIGVDWEHTAMDEIFSDLQSATSAAERQKIVTRALSSGVDQSQLREMLDYLESFGEALTRELPTSNAKKATTQPKGSWATFLSGLIYRYR